MFDGRIYHGRTGAAGEGGHMSIDYRGPRCGCGKLGCIEALASGPAIARRASEQIAAGRRSSILERAEGHLGRITSEMVAQSYLAGDALAKEVLRETAMFLAVWLGNIVDLLEPDVMILGGGAAVDAAPVLSPRYADQLQLWSCEFSMSRKFRSWRLNMAPMPAIAGARHAMPGPHCIDHEALIISS